MNRYCRRDTTYRFTGKITLAALALFIGAGAFAFTLARFLPLSDGPHMNFYPSPSGAMKAAHIVQSGGGAISPHCAESIAVVPANADEDAVLAEELEVYFSNYCDTFTDHRQSPIVEWLSDEKIKITFSINGTAASMRSVKLKKQDASGRVAIEFEAHE